MCGTTFGKNINLQVFSSYSKTCPTCSRKVAAAHTKATIDKKLEYDPLYYQKITAKRKETSLLLHDDSNWNNIHKSKCTCIERYGVDNVRKSDICKAKIKSTKKERYGDENYNNLRKLNDTCMKTYGVEWPMQDARIRSKASVKYFYDNYEFDSKEELCFYVYLKDSKINFAFQPNISFEYECEGKSHMYLPDFIVEGHVVEIKGDHFFKEDGTMCNPYDHSLDPLYEAKHQCMLSNNVKIIKASEMKDILSYVASKYGSSFVSSCKRT